MRSLFQYILYSTLLLFISSCYYNNEEELYGNALKGCDTLNVSFSSDIRLIIDAKCLDCHGENPDPGAAKFNNYEQLSSYLNSNKKTFIESITHTGTSKAMPENKAKLPACDIKKIILWINNNYPNN